MNTALKLRIDEKSLKSFSDMAAKKKHSVNSLVNGFMRLYLKDEGSQWAIGAIKDLNKDVELSTPLLAKTNFSVDKEMLRKFEVKCNANKQGRSQVIRAAINHYIKDAWLYF
ncbi:ribbon-helix-helix domain-containing protein [Psychrobacter sp. AOP31-A1-22]|uniref:ribbon-helix-helix domain-containing protein n=1 Tax=Psychrobacter sp. AOP31-A1-22 TaxID=3457696 RepID=UPI0040356BC8